MTNYILQVVPDPELHFWDTTPATRAPAREEETGGATTTMTTTTTTTTSFATNEGAKKAITITFATLGVFLLVVGAIGVMCFIRRRRGQFISMHFDQFRLYQLFTNQGENESAL